MREMMLRTLPTVPGRRAAMAIISSACLVPKWLAAGTLRALRFGLTPVFLDNDWQVLELLREHIYESTGREVEFVQRRTYKEVVALLLLGEIDAAWLCGYLVMRRVLMPVTRLAREMVQPGGSPQLISDEMIPRHDAELAQLYQTYNGMIRAMQARSEAERRLADRERFVSLGRLAGGLAHEINNPLGGLLNATDTIRQYPDRPEMVRGAADLLDRGLMHLRDVARTTLDAHRGNHAQDLLKPADFEDLHLLIRPEIERKAQVLTWEFEPSAADFGHLPAGPVRQIVLNLLLNAAAVTDPSGAVGIRARTDNGRLCLCVWDTGPGIPMTIRPRLMSDDPIEPGGGLGLRLVRDLVKGLAGEVRLVRSKDGRNEIQVRLPLTRKDDLGNA